MTRPSPEADNYADRRAYYVQHLTDCERTLENAELTLREAEQRVARELRNLQLAHHAWDQFLATEGVDESEAEVIQLEAAAVRGVDPERMARQLVAAVRANDLPPLSDGSPDPADYYLVLDPPAGAGLFVATHSGSALWGPFPTDQAAHDWIGRCTLAAQERDAADVAAEEPSADEWAAYESAQDERQRRHDAWVDDAVAEGWLR